MHYAEPNTGRFEGFVAPSNERMLEIVNDKYERFQHAGASLVRLETDWDDIVTENTWTGIRGVLDKRSQAIHEGLEEMYGPLLDSDSIRYRALHAWKGILLDTLVNQEIEPILEAASQCKLKEGARELYEICSHASIPFTVRTTSPRQVVEAAAHAAGIYPGSIIATELKTNRDSIYNGVIVDHDFPALEEGVPSFYSGGRASVAEDSRPLTISVNAGMIDRPSLQPSHNMLRIRSNVKHFQQESSQSMIAPDNVYDLISIDSELVATNTLIREIFRGERWV